jgi:hypothetical protein
MRAAQEYSESHRNNRQSCNDEQIYHRACFNQTSIPVNGNAMTDKLLL